MDFKKELEKRILILDGGMGTLLQEGLSEEDILRAYIDAGADIITTNSFTANRISQEQDGDVDQACQMAFEAARRARKVADEAGRKVWVAGSLGPTGKSLSLASDAGDPAYRTHSFEQFKSSYKEQAEALIKGGADLLLFETNFDALNLKSAACALAELGIEVPTIISATVSDKSGRTLTGQTLEAFYIAVKHMPGLVAFGINCALGASAMIPLVEDIASFSSHPLIFYPNAGIPDEFGRYNDSPEHFASVIGKLASKGLLNIVGGCCGTTPAHIKALATAVAGILPRRATHCDKLVISGLEAVTIDRSLNFTNIGERTNMAGSKKFARLIAENNYSEALQIAKAQVEGGATVIDINMDDPMVDSCEKMRIFLRHISNEPDIAKAAIMIDSSHWETIVEGLRNTQGRCIVNSVSLKEGEAEFIRKALEINSYGAAMVVMAFDEDGQAVTFERKVEICRRSYKLLTTAGIKGQDIIFDCNILAIATGTGDDLNYALDFIEAVKWIKANLPDARTSGGLSNLSFAFRGNNKIREAIHSVFLYHAIKAGLDMAIVNPQMLQIYDDLDPELRLAIEDVIFNRDADAASRLTALAVEFAEASASGATSISETYAKTTNQASKLREASASDPATRLREAVIKGRSEGIGEASIECLKQFGAAVNIIEGPLMAGMEKVGELFADGKMFLPQVVKSAKTMKEAVDILQPYFDASQTSGRKPVFVIATVQGDVHDIGKNITSIILQCNGFEVIDLGVMVPCAQILDRASECQADFIGVSGLITPSLARMEELCREMSARGMQTPLFVGGAAASAVHTAAKLAPLYDNVHYGADASATAVMAKKYLLSPDEFKVADAKRFRELRKLRMAAADNSGNNSVGTDRTESTDGFLTERVFSDIDPIFIKAETLLPFFDWKMFMAICRSKKDSAQLRDEAMSIIQREKPLALVCARFLDCHREEDSIAGTTVTPQMLREKASGSAKVYFPMLRDGASLADFFPCKGSSQLGIFAVKVECNGSSDIVSFAVRACIAEAVSRYLSDKFSSILPDGFKLIMPGIGYACCPDHSLKRDILSLLPDLGFKLTDSCSMIPETSICGFIIAHRQARFTDIRKVSASDLDAYAMKRGFTESEKNLFLGHLYK